MTVRQKYFDWIMKKNNMFGSDREKLKKYFNTIGVFAWAIIKFIALIWLMNRIYDRIGFDRIMILLMCMLIMSIRYVLRKDKLKVE